MRCSHLPIAVFCLTLAGSFAYAQAPATKPSTPPATTPTTGSSTSGTQASGAQASGNSQNQRMTDCNAEAKTEKLAGQKRKDFMKVCLSSGVDEAKKTTMTQQQKMTKCNADAKDRKGNDRKTFIANCLKAKPSA